MRPPLRLRLLFALLAAAGLALPAHAAGGDGRFSSTFDAAARAAAGFAKLTSDHVAVIDALVRRDTAGRATASAARTPEAAATFSRRLTADERRVAGLTTLSAAEVAQLDALVERVQTARLARTLLAPPVLLARPAARPVEPREKKAEREIHGSFSLSYGMGSGGYSEKSGSMNLTFEDPARGLTINVGYTETHTKGGRGYYGGPYGLPYGLPRATAPDDPFRP
jgi:hypothetical protein